MRHGHDKYKRTIGEVSLPKWYESHSAVRRAGLVLVVSAICAGGYGAGRARARRPRGAERVVD